MGRPVRVTLERDRGDGNGRSFGEPLLQLVRCTTSRRPKAHALASDARSGRSVRLRFTTSDDTGRTAVYILVSDGRELIDYRKDTERRRVPGHVYSVTWRAP